MDEHKINKSEMIRKLNAEGKSRGQIAKILGIRYQFVRNVLENEKLKAHKNQLKLDI